MNPLGHPLNISRDEVSQLFGQFPLGVLVYSVTSRVSGTHSYWATRESSICGFGGRTPIAYCQPILLSNKVSLLTRSHKVLERAAKLQITPEEYTSICEFCRAHQAIMA